MNFIGIHAATSLQRPRGDSLQKSGLSDGIFGDQVQMSPLPTWEFFMRFEWMLDEPVVAHITFSYWFLYSDVSWDSIDSWCDIHNTSSASVIEVIGPVAFNIELFENYFHRP